MVSLTTMSSYKHTLDATQSCLQDNIILLTIANIYAISSDTHQLQFIKLHHFKQERF